MQKFTVQKLATAGVVGAAYAALALFGSIFGVTYGPIQCRFSETAWGLGIGCLIANVFSPYGLLDIVVGSCATFLAALLTARCKKKWLAPLPPVVLNMLLVGAMLAYEEAGASAAFGSVFLFDAATVGIGEAIACYGLGMLLLYALEKSRFFQNRRRMAEISTGSGAKSGENA